MLPELKIKDHTSHWLVHRLVSVRAEKLVYIVDPEGCSIILSTV
jgi:hypothetical protein